MEIILGTFARADYPLNAMSVRGLREVMRHSIRCAERSTRQKNSLFSAIDPASKSEALNNGGSSKLSGTPIALAVGKPRRGHKKKRTHVQVIRQTQ